MTQYENQPFIVGDYNHTKIESMHTVVEKWHTFPNFYTDDSEKAIYGYAAISSQNKVYILGGCCNHERTVSIFGNYKWTHFDNQLMKPRKNFVTIRYGTDIMIIGGGTESHQS